MLLIGVLVVSVWGAPPVKGDQEPPAASDAWQSQGFVSPGIARWCEGVARVEAVLYDGGVGETDLRRKGVLHQGIVTRFTKELSAGQRTRLEAMITGAHRPHLGALCYLPHHGFLFYDKEGGVLGHIEICLMCSIYRSAPKTGLSHYWDLAGLAELLHELGMPNFAKPDEWETFFAREESPDASIRRWAATFNRLDAEGLLAFYDRSEELEVIVSEGRRYRGYAEVARVYREAMEGTLFTDSMIRDVRIRTMGDTAVASFEHRFRARTEEGRVEVRVRTTMTLREIDDRWKIVMEHSSPIDGVERVRRLEP